MTTWSPVKIGDLGDVVTGTTPPSSDPEQFGSKYPFITPSDITGEDRYVDTERFLSECGRDRNETRMLPEGAVCFTCIGATIGKICTTTRSSFTNQQINSVVPDPEVADPGFVYYLLRSQAKRIKGLAGGAATPIVNKTTFSDVSVSLPSLNLQRRVSEILSAYDDLIQNNTRRIAILEEMAQAIYREWFVNCRFPGHEDVEMVESELGPIPEGWEVRKLGDQCRLTLGQSPKSEFYNEDGEGLPFHQGVTDFGDRFPTHRVYCTKDKRVAEEGDILFSVRAPVGRINIAPSKMVIGRGLHAIRSQDGNQEFVHQQLKDRFREEDSMGSGTIFKSVRKSDMLGLELLIPPQSYRSSFEETVSPMVALLTNLTRANEVLRETRDLLLPKLISGEISVEDLDAPLEEAVA